MTHDSPTASLAGRPDRPDRFRRRRLAAVPFALLLAGSLAVAGCSASDGDAADSKAPAAADQRGPDSGTGGSGGDAAKNGAAQPTGATGTSDAPTGAAGTAGTAKTPPPAATYLVRTANLTVQTAHVADALTSARTLADGMGGYAGDEDTSVDAAGHEQSTIQLRVPPASYDRLLTQLTALGKLLNRKVGVEDVTGQVVDVASRIKSQQASVARVRALMNQASGLSDVVSLEGELTTRESALESLEAQQASLKERTNLATVTLRLTEPPVKPVKPAAPKPKKHDGFWTTVGHALGDGWHAFYVTVRAVLVAISAVLPFLVVALAGLICFRLARRRWPRAFPPSMTPPAPRMPSRPPVRVPAPAQGAPEKDQAPGQDPPAE